jgi:hypothetical protein
VTPTSNGGVGVPSAHTTRGDRVRDVIALVLLLGGATLVVLAFAGNRRLTSGPIVVPAGGTAFALWMHNYRMEMTGYAAMIAGVLVGVGSYVVHARRARRARTGG